MCVTEAIIYVLKSICTLPEHNKVDAISLLMNSDDQVTSNLQNREIRIWPNTFISSIKLLKKSF